MEPIYPKNLIVIVAEEYSITNKAEIEKVVNSTGGAVVFVEHKKAVVRPPDIGSYAFYGAQEKGEGE